MGTDQAPHPAAGKLSFSYDQPAISVRFGVGVLDELGSAIRALSAARPFLITAPEMAESASARVDVIRVWSEIAQHVPVALAGEAASAVREAEADVVVAIGGGSAIGLGKAVVLETGLPLVVVPTTYSGSEMTSIYGLSEGGVKRTGRDDRVRPRSVFYDPDLFRSLPADITASSGINALAHCVEALYSADANPLVSAVALRGARALHRGLPVAVENGDDADARAESVLGAHLAGIALSGAGGSIHHQICHLLGGAFDLDHAGTHSVLLPHVMAYVRPYAPEAFVDLAEALGVEDPVAGVESLARRVGAPVTLAQLGMSEEQLEPTAEMITERTKSSPFAVSPEDALAIITGAYEGRAHE